MSTESPPRYRVITDMILPHISSSWEMLIYRYPVYVILPNVCIYSDKEFQHVRLIIKQIAFRQSATHWYPLYYIGNFYADLFSYVKIAAWRTIL